MSGSIDYGDALDRVRSTLRQASGKESILQETAAALHELVDYYTWVGIYLLEREDLVLAAWEGPQATEHTRIPLGSGICGLAARTGKVVNAPAVNEDPRYLMCFPSTRSEIVVPILGPQGVLGEIDIDSNVEAAFDEDDEAFLRNVAGELAKVLEPE